MIAQRRILAAAIGACLLAVLALAPLSSAKPVKAKFKTGTYVAKLAKVGGGFKFKVVGHSATCGKTASAHCFIAVTNTTITEPCANGQSGGGLFGIPNGFVSTKGKFSYFQKLSGQVQPLISFTAKLSGSKATGTLREKELDDINGTLVPCDSGTIHWSAKRH
jgi:hypothetical protein